MAAQLIGAHMPIKGGLGNALRQGKEIGCTAVQVFTSSPQQWYAKPVTPEAIADFKRAQAETGISSVVSHDSYLINLCAPSEEIVAKSFAGLKGEILRCAAYGIPYVVSHMGATKGQEEDACFTRVAEITLAILDDTPDTVTLLMETTAGQGSSLNSKFEELARLIDRCGGHPRLGVCLDTCHIFAAGYDIRTREGYESTFEEFERLVGLDRLKAIHCNDSKKGLGSRVDRHAHIGEGELGVEPFRLLVNDPRFENTPILLETPDAPEMHHINLGRLWELAGRSG
jgi:deoxyribonuclease IV